MFNNGFPVSYPQMPYMQQYAQQQQQARTDIGQVSSEQEAINAYVAAGSSRIMFTPDDKTVYVKCVSVNGQVSMDIFDKRLPAAPEASPEYVTRKEFTEALEALKQGKEVEK